jgi:hypothetical protein
MTTTADNPHPVALSRPAYPSDHATVTYHRQTHRPYRGQRDTGRPGVAGIGPGGVGWGVG